MHKIRVLRMYGPKTLKRDNYGHIKLFKTN